MQSWHNTEAICARCIWTHDWQGLLRTAPCPPTTWAGSVRAELVTHGIHPELGPIPGPQPPFPFCALVMMVKNEADIIARNLAWHYRLGVRRFVIMDNASTDATAKHIRHFATTHPDAPILLLNDPVIAHLQAHKTSAMAQLARTTWPNLRWILPIDADEFLIARHGMQALAYVPDGIAALTIPKTIHFYPTGAPGPQQTPKLEHMTVRSPLFSVPPKILLRALDGLNVTAGNHQATTQSAHPIRYAGGLTYGFYYREFQTRSFPQFLAKVTHGGAAILAAQAQGHVVGGEHWLAWHQTLTTGGETALGETYNEVAFRTANERYIVDPFCFGAS